MLDVPYESPYTYFSPCLKFAYNDLKGKDARDQKIIVFITDGRPDPPTIKLDAEKIAALVPQLKESGIKVYVLAFGPEAAKDWFDNAFGFAPHGTTKGETFASEDASHLLDNMLDIFSRSFGYSRQNVTNQSQIDVTSGATRDRAVVVSLYKPGDEPGFQLTAPDGTSVGGDSMLEVRGKPDPKARREGKPIQGHPVSYAYQWLHKPSKGNYGFKSTRATPIQVAVLYPNPLDITLRRNKNNPIDAVMAGKPAPMEVVISPSSGAGGDPGPIRVLYVLHYLSMDDHLQPDPLPAADEGTITPDGKVFLIKPEFVKDLQLPHSNPYQGYIDIIVMPKDKEIVVAQKGDQMYPVQVYPFVSIQPTPPDVTLRYGNHDVLAGGDDGCAEFHFQPQGKTNALSDGRYTLGVRIDPPIALTGGWRGAKIRFDGKVMDSASQSLWQAVMPFDPRNMTAKSHNLCVQVVAPTRAEKSQMNVQFGVWPNTDDRYQRLNVVDPLLAHVNIEAPSFWQIWKPWLFLLLTMLLMYLTYLYWKFRQLLPPDLTVSLADTAGRLTAAKLGEASFASRWLGLPQDRPVISLSGDKTLGSVRPLTQELFVFVPAKGFGSVMVEVQGEWRPLEPRGDGSWLLEGGKKYRVGTSTDSRFFRLDYAETRPGV